MSNWCDDRVGSAIKGENPTVLVNLENSFAAIGEVQFLPGYCVVLTNQPGVDRISDLPRAKRLAYLADLDLVATAIENVCSKRDPEYRRLNIELLGNRDAFLHTHIFPRYGWEPNGLVAAPIWKYPEEVWTDEENQLGAKHDKLREELIVEITRLRDDSSF